MKPHRVIDKASLATDAQDGKEPLRVVIAYGDITAGQRAMRVLANLGRRLGDDVEFQPIPWSFDLLADVDWREGAASDAVRADILIIATSSPSSLPSAIGEWAKSAINRKRGTSAAVVALFGSDENPECTDSTRLEAIQAAAREAGLDFFAPTRPDELGPVIARVHQRAETVTPVLEEIMHHEETASRSEQNPKMQ